MNQQQGEPAAERGICKGPGCTFYGDPVSGYCSVCAKKFNVVKKEETEVKPLTSSLGPAKASEPIPIKGPSADDMAVDVSPSGNSPSSANLSISGSPDKAGSSRCGVCNKKLGLLGFKCRCDKYYCSAHRYSDQHECSFDYKTKGRDELTKANPVIISPKVEKI